jgi:uncharacterized repeat protein (TIGR04138 family)
MQAIGFQEAVDKICSDESRFRAEAYFFLRDALEATLKRKKKSRKEAGGHVSAAELLDGFRVHALGEFGPMTLTVLDYWGVRSCEDIGEMVFQLVTIGVFGQTDEDTLEKFRDAYDFREAFEHPFLPDGQRLSADAPPVVGREQ